MNKDPRTILIAGIDSEIGAYLRTFLVQKDYVVTGSSRRETANQVLPEGVIFMDLSLDSIELPEISFDIAIICAGMNMGMCKDYPEVSERINVKNTINLIDRLLETGTHVIFLSSNSVFDGNQAFYKYTDIPNPTSNYGIYKHRVEEYLQTGKKNASILRLTKVLTPRASFIVMWEKYIAEGVRFDVYNNHFLSPVSMNDVASTVTSMIEKRKPGIYQLSGNKEISYFDFAQIYFKDNAYALSLMDEQVDKSQPKGKHNSLETHLPS
jgi:dTDP-4-dehydrorhamnose reductase